MQRNFPAMLPQNSDHVKYCVYRYKWKFNTTSVSRPIPHLI